MNWLELTSDQFPQAVSDAQGVCLVPVGCLERHAHHLPLGTDMLIAHDQCQRAARLEPAIVFPDYYLSQILEARHYPGCVGISTTLILQILDAICHEIARNGLKKIVLVNAHGGNNHMLRFFCQSQLAECHDYVVYVAGWDLLPEDKAALQGTWVTEIDGHAGEQETSQILAIRPDLAHLGELPSTPEGMPLERLKALNELGVYTGIWWYGDHPTHYRGDGRPATAEKGEALQAALGRALAEHIRRIKADNRSQQLQDEFYSKMEKPL